MLTIGGKVNANNLLLNDFFPPSFLGFNINKNLRIASMIHSYYSI